MSAVLPLAFPVLALTTLVSVPLYAWRVRGRGYAIFGLIVLAIALPGALVQSSVATLLGLGIGLAFGWPATSGLVLGLALSVASTVVLLRGLEAHNLTTTPAGHAAISPFAIDVARS